MGEKRMYGMALMHLSGIQKGIQFGHAVVDYTNEHITDECRQWATKDKTFIILSAHGVTGLEEVILKLNGFNIRHTVFREPDLGNIPTAVCFIVDEVIYGRTLEELELELFPYLTVGGESYDYFNRKVQIKQFLNQYRLA